MPDVIGEAFVAIRPSTVGFAAEAERGVKSGAKKLALMAGGILAAGFATDFLGSSIGEAQESNKVAAQTDAVLRSIGTGAHISAEGVEELAGAISEKTGIDDEAIQSGENLLLTFKNIRNETGRGNDIFARATRASVDLSVAWKTDMKSASIQLGKALNDPVQGITALTRVGVQFSEKQKETIKRLVETGDTLGAQKIILKEVESQVKGSAEAQATGADKARVAWGNLQESIGKLLIPVLNKLVKIVTPLFKFLAENQDVLMVLAAIIGGALVAAFTAWAISAGAAAAATLAAAAPVLAIIAVIGLVIAALVLVWTKWDEIWGFIRDNPVIAVIVGILAAPIAAFVLIIGGLKTLYENWDSIWGTIKSVAQTAWDFIRPIWETIVNTITVIGYALSTMKGVWDSVWGGVKTAVSEAWDFVKPILDKIIARVQDVIDIYNSVKSFVTGSSGSIDDVTPEQRETLKRLGYGATGGIVTRPTLSVIGENGPEAVVPLSSMPGASPLPSGMGAPSFTFNLHGDIDNPQRWLRRSMLAAREESIVAGW